MRWAIRRNFRLALATHGSVSATSSLRILYSYIARGWWGNCLFNKKKKKKKKKKLKREWRESMFVPFKGREKGKKADGKRFQIRGRTRTAFSSFKYFWCLSPGRTIFFSLPCRGQQRDGAKPIIIVDK